MRFSEREIKELLISTVALAFMFSGFNIDLLPITLFVVVVAFASHEVLGHKLFAQHYGFDAEYRMWPMGIGLGLITALLGGIIFAAPGAVMISPFSKKFAFNVRRMSRKEYGIIAAAGPLVNMGLGFLLLGTILYYPEPILALAAKIS